MYIRMAIDTFGKVNSRCVYEPWLGFRTVSPYPLRLLKVDYRRLASGMAWPNCRRSASIYFKLQSMETQLTY